MSCCLVRRDDYLHTHKMKDNIFATTELIKEVGDMKKPTMSTENDEERKAHYGSVYQSNIVF